jgi:hypothetical protein
VTVYSKTGTQVIEQQPERGFQSSVNPELVFGLNDIPVIDSLFIKWPNNKVQRLTNIKADTTIILNQQNAAINYISPVSSFIVYIQMWLLNICTVTYNIGKMII